MQVWRWLRTRDPERIRFAMFGFGIDGNDWVGSTEEGKSILHLLYFFSILGTRQGQIGGKIRPAPIVACCDHRLGRHRCCSMKISCEHSYLFCEGGKTRLSSMLKFSNVQAKAGAGSATLSMVSGRIQDAFCFHFSAGPQLLFSLANRSFHMY